MSVGRGTDFNPLDSLIWERKWKIGSNWPRSPPLLCRAEQRLREGARGWVGRNGVVAAAAAVAEGCKKVALGFLLLRDPARVGSGTLRSLPRHQRGWRWRESSSPQLLFLLTSNRLRAFLHLTRSLTAAHPAEPIRSQEGRREGAREELNSDKKVLHSRKKLGGCRRRRRRRRAGRSCRTRIYHPSR